MRNWVPLPTIPDADGPSRDAAGSVTRVRRIGRPRVLGAFAPRRAMPSIVAAAGCAVTARLRPATDVRCLPVFDVSAGRGPDAFDVALRPRSGTPCRCTTRYRDDSPMPNCARITDVGVLVSAYSRATSRSSAGLIFGRREPRVLILAVPLRALSADTPCTSSTIVNGLSLTLAASPFSEGTPLDKAQTMPHRARSRRLNSTRPERVHDGGTHARRMHTGIGYRPHGILCFRGGIITGTDLHRSRALTSYRSTTGTSDRQGRTQIECCSPNTALP
jgi:hypothetical protein